jgi:Acetyltransferase (GNAT) family
VAPAGKPSLDDFRGDYAAVADMMDASWGESETPPFRYTPEFLASCFAYPTARFSLAPTIYHHGQPVAFVAGFPRNVRLDGRDLKIIIVALLTVATEHKRRGYGIVVWTELVRRAREAGFDGMVNYCVEGEAMNQMIEGSCRRLDLPIIKAYGVRYLSKVVFPRSSISPVEPPDLDSFLTAAEPILDRAPFTRIWSTDEARWEATRYGAISVRAAAKPADAVLAGYVMQIANRDRTKCLVVDDVLWGSLSEDGRPDLVKQLTDTAATAGARLAIVPILGYADTEPFRTAGFRSSNRLIWMYLTIWAGQARTEPLSSCYLDVF